MYPSLSCLHFMQTRPITQPIRFFRRLGREVCENLIVDLQGLEEVLFYRKGIKCNSFSQILEIPHESTGNLIKWRQAVHKSLFLKLVDAIGEYFLRIRTKSHLSELSFWVTPFPVVFEEHAYWDWRQ